MRRWITVRVLLICWLAASGPISAASQKIWLAGVDPFVRQKIYASAVSDYTKLFEADSRWQRASRQISVFKTSTQWILNGADQELREMFSDLRRRKIQLAMEGLMIRLEGQCGKGIEGYSAPDSIRAAALRIRRLGGDLAYIAMDEPLFYGHQFAGPNSCRTSIDDLARNVALNVKAVREIFPNVKFGDIEPVNSRAGADWLEKILVWADTFKTATGEALTFFHADMDWEDGGSVPMLLRLKDGLAQRGIKIGVIYNGETADTSNVAWVKSAESRIEQLESVHDFITDDAILQTWMPFPERMLPEHVSGTMTNLVLLYARPPSNITIASIDQVVRGKLTGKKDQPISGARIGVFAPATSSIEKLLHRSVSGVVPAAARRALIGLRLNAECACDGEGTIAVDETEYVEANGTRRVRVAFRSSDAKSASGEIFQANAGVPLVENTKSFEVSALESYGLNFRLHVSKGMENGGYLALIFLGENGVEIKRHKVMLKPQDIQVDALKTDKFGRFVLRTDGRRQIQAITLRFDGDENYRGVQRSVTLAPVASGMEERGYTK